MFSFKTFSPKNDTIWSTIVSFLKHLWKTTNYWKKFAPMRKRLTKIKVQLIKLSIWLWNPKFIFLRIIVIYGKKQPSIQNLSALYALTSFFLPLLPDDLKWVSDLHGQMKRENTGGSQMFPWKHSRIFSNRIKVWPPFSSDREGLLLDRGLLLEIWLTNDLEQFLFQRVFTLHRNNSRAPSAALRRPMVIQSRIPRKWRVWIQKSYLI